MATHPDPDPMTSSDRSRMFRTDAEGLARVLGELEAIVMETIWSTPDRSLNAREVSDRVRPQRGVKHVTVVTVLNKLCRKGLLTRSKHEGVLRYREAVKRDQFLESVSRQVAEGMLELAPEIAVSSFVDAVERNGSQALEELRRLIAAREAADLDDGDAP